MAWVQTYSLTDTRTELWQRKGSSEDSRDNWEKNKLCGTRMITGQQSPLLFCWAPLRDSLQIGDILPVLNPPHAWPILKLHWSGEIGPLHPVSPWDPTPLWNLQITHIKSLLGSRPLFMPSLAHAFIAGNGPWLAQPICGPRISGETFGGGLLVPARVAVPLMQTAGICGLTVICDFCREPVG